LQELASGAELTYTENVSADGACVISNRAWQPGELAQVTSFKEQITLQGKVVHSRKFSDDRYAFGLTYSRTRGHLGDVSQLRFKMSPSLSLRSGLYPSQISKAHPVSFIWLLS
jgi:hypothetical protein